MLKHRPRSTVQRSIGLLLGVNVLWLPLSMLFNSLQSLVLPDLVLHFVGPTRKGTVLGLILFAGLAAGALVQPIVGRFSDRLGRFGSPLVLRRGRRQPLIVVGVALTLVCLMGFAMAPGIAILAVAYIGVTSSAGIAQAGFQGLMPDFVPTSLRGRAAGLKGLFELLGSVLGFGVAGILIKKGHPTAVVLVIGNLLVAGTLLSLLLVREGRRLRMNVAADDASGVSPAGPASTLARQSSRQRQPAPPGFGALDIRAAFSHVLLSRFLFLLGVYGIGHFLLYFVRDRLHITGAAAVTGLLLTVFTLETAIVAVGGGILSDRIGRLPVLWGGAVLSAVGAVLLIPASTVAMIIVGGSILSIGSGLFASANWALTADITPRGEGGQFFGVLALATGGAAALAGIFGPLVDHTGYNPLFLIAAASFVLSGVVLPRAEQVTHAMTLAAEGNRS